MRNPAIERRLLREGAQPTHLLFLDGLRGLAALYVLCYHFLSWSAFGVNGPLHTVIAWSAFGHFAVCVFIVLSGFSLMLPVVSCPDRSLRGGITGYSVRRARRILPPYFAALLLSIIAVIFDGLLSSQRGFGALAKLPDLSLGSIVSHIFLFHNLSPKWNANLNMALWSVATEWQIYILFPLLLLPVWRRWGTACVWVGFITGLLPLFLLPPYWNFEGGCPWFLGLFAIGMVGASYYKQTIQSSRRVQWLVPILGLSCITYLIAKWRLTNTEYAPIRDAIAGTICITLILLLALPRKESGTSRFLTRLLSSRTCVALGAFSYSLYLTHCIVLKLALVATRNGYFSPNVAFAIRAILGIPSALLLGYIFHIYFERPFLSNRRLDTSIKQS